MGAPRRGEAGNVQAIEVLLFILLLAIPLVLLQSQPLAGTGSVAPREGVAQALEDWMRHVAAAPDPNGVHATLLDKLVAEALQGNTTGMASRLGHVLPKVTAYNVFLDNGVARLALRSDGTPPGEAVSAVQLWSPAWAPILAAPQVSLLDAERSALRLALLPLHRARGLQDDPGLRVEVELELPVAGDGSVNLTSFAPLTNGTNPGPGVVLSLLNDTGAQVFSVAPDAANATLFFGVRETQGREVPGGTTLEVRLPPGFRDVAVVGADNLAWTALSREGNTTYGWVVKGNLLSPLTSAMQQLKVEALRPSALGHFHLVEARFGEGDLGALRGLFVDTANATSSAALPPGRGPFLTLPGRAPWSTEALAGVLVANPDPTVRTLTVKRVQLTAQGGVSLLSASGVEPASGWVSGADSLTWSGSLALANDTLREFRFNLRADALVSEDSVAVRGFRADLQNGFTPWTWWARTPGEYALRMAGNASLQGFVETVGTHEARLNATHRGAPMKGNATYETVDTNVIQASASDLARGLDESSLLLTAARAPLGGSVTATWDLDRLREELVGGPSDPFKCYTSTSGAWAWRADRADCLANGGLDWQFRDEAPTVNLTVLHPSPAAEGAVGAVQKTTTGLAVAGSTSLAVPVDAMLGTHAVELRADFRLEGPAGAEMVQTVRLLGAFDVHRPGGATPVRPLYDVIIQAWLEDWT